MSNIFTHGVKYYIGTMPQDRKRQSVNTEDVLNQVKRCRSSSSASSRYKALINLLTETEQKIYAKLQIYIDLSVMLLFTCDIEITYKVTVLYDGDSLCSNS